MLALCCDYRVMTDGEKRNAWMCMNEVRAPNPTPFGDRTDILTLQSSPDPLWFTLATIFYEHS